MIKRRLGILGLLMAAIVQSDAHIPTKHNVRPKRKDTPEQQKMAVDKAAKAKGMTQFFYGVHSVWALNKNSADKKARKNNWI